MRVDRLRIQRVLSSAVIGIAVLVPCVMGTTKQMESPVATCPPGEVPSTTGVGCQPHLTPGGGAVGAPSEEVLSDCHGGNVYYCQAPYRQP